MPATLPVSPQEAREILALRRRQADIRKNAEKELDGMVTSIEEAREALSEKLHDYVKASDQLRQASRRMMHSEVSLQYRNYATMQTRLGGAISQALRRAENGSRMLDVHKKAQEERVAREEQERERQEIRAAERSVQTALLPPHDDDFESLYGDYSQEAEPVEEGWHA